MHRKEEEWARIRRYEGDNRDEEKVGLSSRIETAFRGSVSMESYRMAYSMTGGRLNSPVPGRKVAVDCTGTAGTPVSGRSHIAERPASSRRRAVWLSATRRSHRYNASRMTAGRGEAMVERVADAGQAQGLADLTTSCGGMRK